MRLTWVMKGRMCAIRWASNGSSDNFYITSIFTYVVVASARDIFSSRARTLRSR